MLLQPQFSVEDHTGKERLLLFPFVSAKLSGKMFFSYPTGPERCDRCYSGQHHIVGFLVSSPNLGVRPAVLPPELLVLGVLAHIDRIWEVGC